LRSIYILSRVTWEA